MFDDYEKLSKEVVGYMADIVLPVYNGLTYVKECLQSILEHTERSGYRLYIIDDCSDSVTASFLEKEAAGKDNVILHRNEENEGFIRSCNRGISLGKAPYVVIVNSDVIVTPGWLSRMVRCAESDPAIAMVNPFTNHASNINIPLAPGANFFGMDMVLRTSSPQSYPDVVTGVGFCMLLRRSALEQVGLFDEAYGRGYCEESDLCMRFYREGFRTVVADDVYVYHKGKASFKDRDERYRHNRRIFDSRWKEEYERMFKAFLAADPLKPSRDLFRLPRRWDPVPSMRETYRSMRGCFRQRRFLTMARVAAGGVKRLPGARREVVTPEAVARYTRPGRLRVTYVLPNLAVAGGVLSVVQLVNELILLGVEARIAALREYPEIYNWKFYTRPIVYAHPKELVKNFPESDLAVATHWTTAPLVAEVVKAGRARKAAYFIQDYESWFFPESDQKSRRQVLETYRLIPHKIVKSDWLKGMLERDGYKAYKIPLGMDLAVYYPREVTKPGQAVITAMARPRTPRRGFPYLVEALKEVKEALPEVEIRLFGEDLSIYTLPFSFQDEKVIVDQDRMAELYSGSDIFIDASVFQGFGRPALEAMACGTACVLTGVGGVTEYARDGVNCLVVPPGEPGLIASAVLRLLKDEGLRERLVQGGLETVKDYCHKREARQTLEFFKSIIGGDV